MHMRKKIIKPGAHINANRQNTAAKTLQNPYGNMPLTIDTSHPGNYNQADHQIKWLDEQDILTATHISKRTLQKFRQKGILPYTRFGKKILYRQSDFLAILKKNFTGKW